MQKMTPEHKAKLMAANAASLAEAQEAERNALVCGEWRVWRLDDANLVVQKGDDFSSRGYYPDWEWAILALFRKRLADKNHTSIDGLKKHIDVVKAQIIASVRAASGQIQKG